MLFTCSSYGMGMSALPDMYARSPRTAGPEGIHIRLSKSAHFKTNMLHLTALLKSAQTSVTLDRSTYIFKGILNSKL